MKVMTYIRRKPFSISSLCNIIGDLCYLGFAFDAQGMVSPSKLAGALFTVVAQTILIAYADNEKFTPSSHTDYAGRLLVWLNKMSLRIVNKLPSKILHVIRAKPVGICFAMLALNGLGLFTDAVMSSPSIANLSQIMLGAFLIVGCGAFSLADYVKSQKLTNLLLKIGPAILMTATMLNVVLAVTTHNGFMILSCVVFLTSNFVGFYTKIDKSKARAT